MKHDTERTPVKIPKRLEARVKTALQSLRKSLEAKDVKVGCVWLDPDKTLIESPPSEYGYIVVQIAVDMESWK